MYKVLMMQDLRFSQRYFWRI